MKNVNNKFSFDTGVVVTFLHDSLNVKASNYNSNINYINLDNYTYKNVSIPRATPFSLAIRTLVFGWIFAFIILIPVKDEWGALFFTANAFDIFLAWLAMIVFAGSFLISALIFWGFVFSAAIQTSFLSRFINNYFSDHRVLVIIGNKSGNNIQFYTLDNEITKIKEVEKEISNRKKSNKGDTQQDDFFSNIKKLEKLLKENLLTQEEFDFKKKQLLGL
ncbi:MULTISPECIES: hypothetical protein [Flavobacterium]|uniref:hypothetical protein n=1 Tax=Flavobacterium TaxID=237 RepID=UPI0011835ABB|nr:MULTISPECIES: hypothetical protein [Flavobacterium]MCR4030285.1 hypothetical protein [Flavobacterium panacis]